MSTGRSASVNSVELSVKVVRLLPPRPLPPRPLPALPRPLVCKICSTSITTENAIRRVPESNSRAFKGFSGKASLFNSITNARLAPPRVQLMATGVHTMQEITCSKCSAYLGWKILQARNRSEKWKEGSCLLELECLAQGKPPSTTPT